MKKNAGRRNPGNGRIFEVAGVFLIILAIATLLAIIAYLILPFIFKDMNAPVLDDSSVNGLVLGCVTLSITLSILVPWMMSKSQIHAIAEESVKKYYDKDFKQEIRKTHNTLFKAYANDSRMIAYFLIQHNKPIWALGWVCKSSISYDNIQETSQRRTYTALSVSNLFVLIDCIRGINRKLSNGDTFLKVINDDNDEKMNEVAIRTTRDLVKFCATQQLRDKDYSSVFADKKGKDIPETLYIALNDLLKCLIKYLGEFCSEKGTCLLDRLELENIDEVHEEEHLEYYSLMEKECHKADFENLENQFKATADSLQVKYNEYITNRIPQ